VTTRKERLLGSRGQRVNRPELLEVHGFDTKYARHAARLGYQGLELLESGWLTLPMPKPERSCVMAIRTGRSFADAIAEIEEVERQLADALRRAAGAGTRRRCGRRLPPTDLPARLALVAAAPERRRLDHDGREQRCTVYQCSGSCSPASANVERR
jgi:hypothetical protein